MEFHAILIGHLIKCHGLSVGNHQNDPFAIFLDSFLKSLPKLEVVLPKTHRSVLLLSSHTNFCDKSLLSHAKNQPRRPCRP